MGSTSRTALTGWIVLLAGASSLAVAGPREDAIDKSIGAARSWFATLRLEPFAEGLDGFRNYVLGVETRHRIWLVEKSPAARSETEESLRAELRRAMDADRLGVLLADPNAAKAYTDVAVLADRCLIHGVDPAPTREAMRRERDRVLAEVRRAPPSLVALYAKYLPAAGLAEIASSLDWERSTIVARKPREADLTLNDVYYLTHEIFALTDYASQPLPAIAPEDRAYLVRVLPFYTLFYCSLGNLDIAAELLSCLHAAGMEDTWGYQDGIRTLVERQNPDGSFGTRDERSMGRPIQAADYLHPTMNCLWALLLDRQP